MVFCELSPDDLDDLIQRLAKGVRLEPEVLTPDHLAQMTRAEMLDRIERLHFHIIRYPSTKRYGAVLAGWYAEIAVLSLRIEVLRLGEGQVVTYTGR